MGEQPAHEPAGGRRAGVDRRPVVRAHRRRGAGRRAVARLARCRRGGGRGGRVRDRPGGRPDRVPAPRPAPALLRRRRRRRRRLVAPADARPRAVPRVGHDQRMGRRARSRHARCSGLGRGAPAGRRLRRRGVQAGDRFGDRNAGCERGVPRPADLRRRPGRQLHRVGARRRDRRRDVVAGHRPDREAGLADRPDHAAPGRPHRDQRPRDGRRHVLRGHARRGRRPAVRELERRGRRHRRRREHPGDRYGGLGDLVAGDAPGRARRLRRPAVVGGGRVRPGQRARGGRRVGGPADHGLPVHRGAGLRRHADGPAPRRPGRRP